jgi:hypothetical protein
MNDKPTKKLVKTASRRKLSHYWCTECVQLVTMVSVEEAAALFGTSLETLADKIAEQRIHTMKSSAQVNFICLGSLWEKAQVKAVGYCTNKLSRAAH